SSDSVCRPRRVPGNLVLSAVTRRRGANPWREESISSDVREPVRTGAIARRRGEVVSPIRAGRVRGRLRHPELRRLLVLFALRCQPGNAWRDFFLGKHLCRDLSIAGISPGVAFRPDQDDGRDASSFQHLAYFGTADAEPV